MGATAFCTNCLTMFVLCLLANALLVVRSADGMTWDLKKIDLDDH
jgi:hypothetical protein